MEPAYWRQVKSIFQAALAVEQTSREEFIRESCANDEPLAAEVRALLAAHSDSGAFLETPAPSLVAGWRPVEASLPERLGPWKILGSIGRGGMADVYLVERCDGHFEKRAALKVLRSGLFGDDVGAHFARERQVLADLDHPYIVRLLDGGVTEDHRPYLVMEFVDGVRITEYAHSLSRADRIGLFLRVCEAVGYAHEHGVVHRDLKPGNILVTAGGEPRVLDFGIAKLVLPESSGSVESGSTLTHCFTMEYASPEQVRGEPATKASDVHGLGLVFYEILLDRPPFELGPLPMYEAARVVCEQTPDLADLTSRLAVIVGKAIRKDPAQRYASVSEFLAAIQDYLKAPGWQRLTNRKVRRAFLAAGFLAAAMGLGALLMLRPAWRLRPGSQDRPKIYQLTSYPGLEEHPDLSPDGLSIVFSRVDHGIWWRAIQDAESSPLTDQGDCCVRWSPDGKQLAFARWATPGECDVMLMDAKGGPARKIARIQGMNLSWAADGKSLAVVDRYSADGSFRIVRVDIDTGARTSLTDPPAGYWGDVECAYSPDGKSLAFVRYASKGDGDLYVTSTPGGEPRLLTNEHTWITGMAWTPDSRNIIFPAMRTKGGAKPTALWWIPADAAPTTEPTRVPGTDEGYPTRPAIARRYLNGAVRLVFQVEQWHSKLWRMALSEAGHNLPVKVEDWPSWEEQPALSPDGKRIAFTSNRSTFREVWVSELDGSNATQMTDIRSLDTAWPRWSPDGSRLCFVSRVDGQRSVYVVNPGGANLRRVVNSGNDADVPSWSSDGRWIYFRSARSGSEQIWKVAATGEGQPVAVTKGGGVDAYESPDGKFVYFLRSHDRARLWRVPVGPGAEEEVPNAPLLKSGYWVLTEKGVCLFDVYGVPPAGRDAMMLRLFPFERRPVMSLGEIPEAYSSFQPGISVRRDAGAVVWAGEEHSSDLFLMDGFH